MSDESGRKSGGLFARLKSGLARSAQRLSEGITAIVAKRKLDDATLGELEELLVAADLGLGVAQEITARLKRSKFNQEVTSEEIRAALAEAVVESLRLIDRPLKLDPAHKPFVILVVGVNGSGKTTTIGKLAKSYTDAGRKVVIAAGDTFRAAAVEQLKIWGERAGAEVISRGAGADAAGLAFDALETARRQGADVLLIDTAGRLHNKTDLMAELQKIQRVLKKAEPSAPHAVLLVLDATVGQNAIAQVETFREIIGVTGLVMTKLDGTAKGGVLVALAEKTGVPVHFIGIGEGIEDLRPFRAEDFAKSLVGLEN
jgi:fused signal recognition particle receptor